MRGRLFVTSSWLFHGVYNLHEEQSRPARRTPAAARIFRRRKRRPRSPSRSDQRTWCHLSELSLGFMSTCRRHFIFPLRLTFYHLWAFSKTEKDLQHSNVKNYFPITVVMRASEPSNRVDFIAMRGATWIGPRHSAPSAGHSSASVENPAHSAHVQRGAPARVWVSIGCSLLVFGAVTTLSELWDTIYHYEGLAHYLFPARMFPILFK